MMYSRSGISYRGYRKRSFPSLSKLHNLLRGLFHGRRRRKKLLRVRKQPVYKVKRYKLRPKPVLPNVRGLSDPTLRHCIHFRQKWGAFPVQYRLQAMARNLLPGLPSIKNLELLINNIKKFNDMASEVELLN